jgi:hypothetical protein
MRPLLALLLALSLTFAGCVDSDDPGGSTTAAESPVPTAPSGPSVAPTQAGPSGTPEAGRPPRPTPVPTTPQAPPRPGKQLTKPELIAQADAVCTAYRKATRGMRGKPVDFAEIAKQANRWADEAQKAADQLRALEPPAADAAAYSAYTRSFAAIVPALRRVSGAAVNQNARIVGRSATRLTTLAKRQAGLATAFGFKLCRSA